MRILFADDSMTAQNMGKKILTEAGYEVVAVSNGAAAVKKIAEQKPDIIILDIYMPGYTGLEVCDKVRASVETLKTPVLLTVGKMEPYRAEDANRVKADGVIIKPFEASDLLAVIKKLEERVVPKTVAVADQTIRLDRLPDLEEFTPEASQNHTEMHVEASENTTPAIVDVPDNMATSAAFSDLLGPEPVHSFEPLLLPRPTPEPSAEPPVAVSSPFANAAGARNEVVEIPEFTALPSEDVEEMTSGAMVTHEMGAAPSHQEEASATSTREEEFEVEEAHFVSSIPEETASAEPGAEASSEAHAPSIPDTQPIPVYQEPEPEKIEVAATSSSETPASTAAPSDLASSRVEHWVVEEIPSSAEPHKSGVSVEPVIPVPEPPSPEIVSPALATETADYDSFSAKVDAKIREMETIVSAAEARHVEVEIKPPTDNGFGHSAAITEVTGSADDDFDARVAAAMTIYEEPVEEAITTAPAGVAEPKLVAGEALTYEQAPEPASLHMPSHAVGYPIETPCSFEYSPPVTSPEPHTIHEQVAHAKTPEPLAQTAHHLIETPVRIEPTVPAAEPEPATEAESAISSHQEQPSRVMKAIPFLVETPVRVQPAVPAAEPEPAVEFESTVSSHQETPNAVVEAVPAPVQSRVDDEKIISEIEAQLPADSVASSDPGLDTQVIASAVHRVLERLKPQLIEEISRELKSSK